MEYKVTGIIPLQPIVVQYTEDEVEKEDMFYLSPENGALIPAFDEDSGPKEPKNFGKAFAEGWKNMVQAQKNKIVTASSVPPGEGSGLVVPK